MALASQLVFGGPAVGDVFVGACLAVDAAGGVAQDERPAANPAVGTVLVAHAELQPRQVFTAFGFRAQLGADAVDVVGMKPLGPFLAAVGEFILCITEHCFVAWR